MFLPEYAKQLFESSRMALDQLNTQLRWAYFDDSSRLVVRASYLDDGYVRAKVDTATALDVNLLEILRELSWPFYNIAQIAVRADSLQNLDIPLSTRASESTLSAIKSKTDNLDVLLSTRASESTLSSFSGKFSSAVALSDSLSNPTTTVVGSAILGFDGTYWRRVRVDTSGRLAIQNQPNFDVALSTIKSKTDNIDIALSALRDFFKPLIKGSIFNQSVTANTNIFSSNLTPSIATTSNPSYFRIFACFNTSGVLSVVKTVGTTTVTMQLNSGNALNENCLYAFDIAVGYGESVNLQYSVNATALELKVVEIASTVV